MKIENLKVGMVIKNYKELCKILEIKPTSGDAKQNQLNKLAELVEYHKQGNKFVIDNIKKFSVNPIDKLYTYKKLCELFDMPYKKNGNSKDRNIKIINTLCKYEKIGHKYKIIEIYDEPKEYEDKRTSRLKYNMLTKEERQGNFNGFYVYAHYIDNEVIYIGKGCRARAISNDGRKYRIQDLTNIKILKRFGNNELEALDYEEEMIDYYKSIGQCKYNDESYHIGNISTKEIKLQKEYDKLVNEKELLIQKLNMIDLQIEDLKDKLA